MEVTHLVPQTPDQEAFLKEHFVTLADLSASGTDPSETSTDPLGPESSAQNRLVILLQS